MFSIKEMSSPSSLFSAYASMTASIMLFRSMANELVPRPIRNYLFSTLTAYFSKPRSPILTLVIEESSGGSMARNQLFEASEVYLCTRINPDTTRRLKVSKTPKDSTLTIRLEKGEKVVDSYQGVELNWSFAGCAEAEKGSSSGSKKDDHMFPPAFNSRPEQNSFELSFHKQHKDMVVNSYLPYILEKAKAIREGERVLKMFTLNTCGGKMWSSINLEHPATFDTLAMDPELKSAVIEDLNRFVRRKEFYKRVGRAWKRGYLLYGPPGTGKSSMVAAMANYLKFDVYDLQLANIRRDSDLRSLLLGTGNRSILVIEDIDCSVDLPDRQHGPGAGAGAGAGAWDGPPKHHVQLTLSGLLNFIDGLWSSCGDERIIIFTTNHKDRLDPALLRPGRMDMHIHMSYCHPQGFKLLASNYLGIGNYHYLFGEIEDLLKNVEVTPAQLAEELMKNEDADVALEGVVNLLKRKKQLEGNEPMDKDENKSGFQEAKRQKVEK